MNYLPVIVPSSIAMTRPNIQVNIIGVLGASNILSKYHTGPGCVDFFILKAFSTCVRVSNNLSPQKIIRLYNGSTVIKPEKKMQEIRSEFEILVNCDATKVL